VNSSLRANARSNRIPTTLRFRNYIWEHVKKLAHFISILQHVRLRRIYLQALNDKQPTQPSKESRRLHDLSNTEPFAFHRLIDLLRLSGANIGSRMNTCWTATKFLGDAMHQSMLSYLVHSNSPVTIVITCRRDALKYMVRKKINGFYYFLESARKRIDEFRDVLDEYNFPRIEFTYLYPNRWISIKPISNFIIPTLEKTLSSLAVSPLTGNKNEAC
jgi:hypothetical protein